MIGSNPDYLLKYFSLYQGGVKSTVFGVFEELLSSKFQKATSKIGSFPVSALYRDFGEGVFNIYVPIFYLFKVTFGAFGTFFGTLS